MAQQNQNVCIFNKFGFCKFRINCRKQHILEICSNQNCESKRCSLRHPKLCRYFRDIGYCKFGEWCKFKHENGTSKEMEGKFKMLDAKFETMETNYNILRQCISEKEEIIENLKDKIMIFEEKIHELENLHGAKIEHLEETMKQAKAGNNVDEKIKVIEEKQMNIIEDSKEKYKCNKCDFSTYFRKGLNIHKKKMHKVYSCVDCDELFDDLRDSKVHSYTHFFTITEKNIHKCKNCDFETKTLNSIEVHVGGCREINFECGLCGNGFEYKVDLETHLRTCEIFECDSFPCWLRLKNLSDMKKHITEKHANSPPCINHLKIDRECEFLVNSKSYNLEDL